MSYKKIDFTKLGGFPLTQDTLAFMQLAYQDKIDGVAGRMGDGVILSGMIDSGTAVTGGWIIYDGEILPFKAGNKQTYFIIENTNEQVQFEDDSVKTVYFTRQARFGSGAGQVEYASLKRLDTALKVQQDLAALQTQVDELDGFVPQGLISMWSGAINAIPEGWALCDGTNGTPNLSGRFIVGYDQTDFDYNAIGAIGGEKKHELTIAEMPEHHHTMTFDEYPDGETANPGYDGGNNHYKTDEIKYTNNVGEGEPHENRPPYFTLAYIMKL